MRDFRGLKVWQKAHQLALAVYKATMGLPTEEKYGVTSQTRRAAVSIPANIAEGCGRSFVPEMRRFLEIAMGSASELEYHLLLSRDLGFLSQPDHERLAGEASQVKRMLATYITRIRASEEVKKSRRNQKSEVRLETSG